MVKKNATDHKTRMFVCISNMTDMSKMKENKTVTKETTPFTTQNHAHPSLYRFYKAVEYWRDDFIKGKGHPTCYEGPVLFSFLSDKPSNTTVKMFHLKASSCIGLTC